jgi:hypothetical protein
MSGTDQPRNPHPWDTGPLPDPPALTAEEEADWEAYLDQVEHMQMRDLDQRAETEPQTLAAPAWLADWWAREPGRSTTNEAGREPEAQPEAEAGQ